MKAGEIKSAGDALRVFVTSKSPVLMGLVMLAAVGYRLTIPSVGWADLVVAAAVVAFWPLQEWLIHVCILHWRARKLGPVTLDMHVARKHREHHGEPHDLELTWIPFRTLVRTLVAYAVILAVAAPTQPWAWTLVATYTVMALHYEWCHFVAHIGWTPPLAYYKRIKRLHQLHHFKNEQYWMGVSMTAADGWLRTSPDPKTTERSPNCRRLHGTDEGQVPA